MKKILVAGAGLGGLAAAIRLAQAGHQVEIWEKNEAPGGKLREVTHRGYRWGTGPSLLTMPHVLRELFAVAGERMEDHLTLERLPVTCRYFWQDGTVIDEDEAFWRRPEVARFLSYARGIYELAGEAYLNRPPAEFWRAFSPRHWPKLRHLGKIATTRTLADEVHRRITDPHLRDIFLRFATYNGSSPFLTPATFNIISFVEADFGGWYVKGGLPRISEALAALAEKRGVTFRFDTTLTEWQNHEAIARDGTRTKADYLVCNADALGAAQSFLRKAYHPHEIKRLLQPALSTSGIILFLGVEGCDSRLSHHNIFFSDHYAGEFRQIHGQQIAPTEPTIYIAVSSRSDPTQAPTGHDNYFVLVNVPARDPAKPWTTEEKTAYRDLILLRLESFGLKRLRERIVTESIFTPTDFATRDLAHHGALYGWASHSIRTSLFRPPLRSSRDRSVFFAGGTTHPGGGIPLVLLSGRMAAEQLLREAA